jgi:ATP-dependent Clp protease ATP-binding subunit ClpX
MIPEFVGRFNSIANCNELTVQDLVEILTKPKNAIIKQYQHLFSEENVKLSFTQEALEAIGQKAKESGTGARALRVITESLLRDLMFEVPSDPSIKEIVIEKESILEGKEPRVIRDRSA